MKEEYRILFDPITIRGKEIRNRFEAAPVSMGPVTRGKPPVEQTMSELSYSSQGGFGIYTIGEVFVCDEGNRREPLDSYDFKDQSEENLYPYRMAAECIKQKGCLAMIEISHCGSRKKGISYGPMDLTHSDGSRTYAMDEEKIREVCRDFADTAVFMKKAGFDGIMGHFGHGWLVQQFLSPLTNQRTDCYGGSIENRARLALEIVKEIRKAAGEEFIIEVRMSGDELVEGGYHQEEFLEYAGLLDPYVDIIHVSMGLYGNPVQTREFSGMYHDKGCNAYLAEALKQVVKHARVSVVGAINDPQMALDIIREGKADFVALGRQKFADPRFVTKLLEGKEDQIYPCLRCFCCFSGPMDSAEARGWEPGCSVNPLHMRYEYIDMPAPRETKRALVVGGGIAGLYFAATASKRGHHVVLVEREMRLGGILNAVEPDIHKEAFIRYLRALEASARAQGTEILTGRTVTEELLEQLAPQIVVMAAGAHPRRVEIPGEQDAVPLLQAVGAMSRLEEIGERVVILGGGLIGCELAVYLRKQGRQVTIASRSELLKHTYPLHKAAVCMELAKGVRQLPYHLPVKRTAEGIIVRDREGKEQLLPADTVIDAFGLESNRTEIGGLEAMISQVCPQAELVSIGDYKRPRRIKEAVSEAFLLAMQLGCDYRPKKQESHWK